MKIVNRHSAGQSGFALFIMLGIVFCCLIILAGALDRSRTIATLNNRNNSLALGNSVAEAAVEKVYARMAVDFAGYGVGLVTNSLDAYRGGIPNEDAYWSNNFQFYDAQGNVGRTYVNYYTNYSGPLPSAYKGLFCSNSPVYRIISNVTYNNAPTNLIATAQEDVLLACVPLTTWAIFYNGLMEFTQCATMTVNGRVHANGPIYVGTTASVSFSSPVTTISTLTAPFVDGLSTTLWNSSPSSWGTSFTGNPGYSTNVPSITVAMNMTNSHFLIDIPSDLNDWQTITGAQRLYNQAQMIVIVTNDPATSTNPEVILTLQRGINGQVPAGDAGKQTYVFTNAVGSYLATNLPFLTLSNQFYDQREYKTNMVTQIDVGRLSGWLLTNSMVQERLPTNQSLYPTILYVADRRNASATKMPVVRVTNGSQIPCNANMGFSVATPNPLYVWGDYNIKTPNGTCQSNQVNYTYPSALLSDSLTVLSTGFTDSETYTAYNNSTTTFDATSMIINAAIVTGTMPTTGTSGTTFSGGVHNLPRLLEDWSNKDLWLNTSILRLWTSQIATNQFRNPQGFSPSPVNPYYNPPTRHYAYNLNYMDPAKVPPGIPYILMPLRFGWATPPPGVVTYKPYYDGSTNY
jgi:hypothetical protein